MHFVSSLPWKEFSQLILRYILSWEVFWQHNCRYILCPRRHEMSDTMFRYILCSRWHGTGLVKTCWVTFYFLASMGSFLFSFALSGYGQHKLRCILWPRWRGRNNSFSNAFGCPSSHGRGLVSTCWDTIWVLAGVEGV